MISSEYISLSIVAFWVKKWQIGIRLLMFILYILSLKISVSGPHHPPPCPCKCLVFPGLWLLMSRVALWPCRAAHVLGAGGGAQGVSSVNSRGVEWKTESQGTDVEKEGGEGRSGDGDQWRRGTERASTVDGKWVKWRGKQRQKEGRDWANICSSAAANDLKLELDKRHGMLKPGGLIAN